MGSCGGVLSGGWVNLWKSQYSMYFLYCGVSSQTKTQNGLKVVKGNLHEIWNIFFLQLNLLSSCHRFKSEASKAPVTVISHRTSTASSMTVMSVLHLAEGLMASSAGGMTKLLLSGSHMPSPKVYVNLQRTRWGLRKTEWGHRCRIFKEQFLEQGWVSASGKYQRENVTADKNDFDLCWFCQWNTKGSIDKLYIHYSVH